MTTDGKTILLVEDEALIALAEARMLEGYGFNVLTAHSGKKAVEAVEANPDIDLILMDIDLGHGKMDGTEAAKLILQEHSVPIVFLSSHTEPEVVEKTEGITSYGYIVKNSGETVIMASIRMAFRLFEAHTELKKRGENLRTAMVKYEQTAADLAISEEKYRALFNQSFQGVYLHDVDGNIIDVNDVACTQSGYTRDELLGMSIFDFHPEGSDTVNMPKDDIKRLWREWEPGQRITVQAEHLRSDGSAYPVENITGPVQYGGKRLILAIVQDITDRRKAERAARVSEENLRMTLDSIGDAVISVDVGGRVTRMNPVAERLCGWSMEAAYGKSLEEVFHIVNAETGDPAENPCAKVLATGNVVGLANHTMLISKDGREYQIADSASPIRDDGCNIQGVVIVFRDVTEQYEKDSQLRERVKELNCLYEISKIIEEPGINLDGILKKTATAISKGYSCPEQTACRIILDGKEYLSDGFVPGYRVQDSRLYVEGRDAGAIEVHVSDDALPEKQDPFLEEERQLLNAVAERLGRVIERLRKEELLRESEARWKFALDNAGDGLWDWNAETNKVFFSPKWKEILGYEEKEIGDTLDEWDRRIHPDDKEKCYKDLEDHFNGRTEMYRNIHRVQCKNGHYKWILDRGKVVEWKADGTPLRVIGTHVDITERRQMEQDIRENQKRLQAILDHSPLLISEFDTHGRYLLVNPAIARIFNTAPSGLAGKTFEELLPSGTVEVFKQRIAMIEKSRVPMQVEDTLTVDGDTHHFLTTLFPLVEENGRLRSIGSIAHDITLLKNAEAAVSQQLGEKQILLKEIHHRIKNNISSIANLLSGQASCSTDSAVQSALMDASSRVHSMQILYEKLLLKEDYRDIPVRDYIDGLLSSLNDVFAEGKNITQDKHIEDFTLPSKTLFPLGIIINELYTNILKYSFPAGRGGRVVIRIEKNGDRVTMVIQDNGVGLPKKAATGGASKGFGLQLVHMLSEQLDGTFSIENQGGTKSVLEFRLQADCSWHIDKHP